MNDREDRVGALIAFVRAVHRGDPPDPQTLHYLSRAILHWLLGDGPLDECLGLRPRRGGRHETAAAIARREFWSVVTLDGQCQPSNADMARRAENPSSR